MLEEISIKNFAIIDQLEVNFSNGMTVLTGETGAGKSIIIDAVGLLAGGRGSQHYIRTGENKAVLQGLFSIKNSRFTKSALDDLGIDYEDNNLILQREIYRNGKNICRINGMLVNTSSLKRVGETLVDIYGQNEHQALMQPEKHINLLDEYAHDEIKQTLNAYHDELVKYKKLKGAVNRKHNNEKEWAQRIDMLEFQTNEIKQADLQIDEESELISERDRLNNFQIINDNLKRGFTSIDGDEELSPLVMIGEAMTAIESIERIDDSFKNIAESIRNAYYALQDASGEISSELDNLEFDQDRLNEIELRLNLIYELKRKYGDSIQSIISYYDDINDELNQMKTNEQNSENIEGKLTDSINQLNQLGDHLKDIRHKASKKLIKDIHEQLSDLYMDKTKFDVRYQNLDKNQFGEDGIELVEFYIRTNPGEDMQPLSKIASGGELSRIMLALKTIFTRVQGLTSIIFDEVDTGVSGRVAQAIAEKIYTIGAKSQVLCITHLPQVAAMSDNQYFIEKNVDDNKRTETSVQELKNDQRIKELARMLAGNTITQLTLDHAKELLALADKQKSGIK